MVNRYLTPGAILDSGNLWNGRQDIADDILFRLGTTGDIVLLNRSTSLAANTALTDVLEGTPPNSPALAADSLIISNITDDGDILLAVSGGDTSRGFLHMDASAGVLTINPQTRTVAQTQLELEGTGDDVLVLNGDSFVGIQINAYRAASDQAVLNLRGARGTEASPTATQSSDMVGRIQMHGYDGSSFQLGGRITIHASETWTGSARGSEIRFATIDNTTTAIDDRLIISHDGGFAFQQAATISTTTGEIRVSPANSIFMLNGGTDIRFGASARRIVRGIQSANSLDFYAQSQDQLAIDEPGDGEVGILVRRNVASTLTMQRVSMGAADSGGTGFKYLRVPN